MNPDSTHKTVLLGTGIDTDIIGRAEPTEFIAGT